MFVFDENLSYRMPAHFGGTPSAGQVNLRYDDVTAISISYLTDEEMLSQYVPDAFEIMEPVIDIGYQKCCGIQWMYGGHYSLIAVMTPARHIASGTEGAYVLVIWENKTAPILGGREETGMPKIFADIPDYHIYNGHITANASHEGRVFLELEMDLGEAFSEEELSAMTSAGRVNQLGWRYIPNLNRPGAALSHPTLYPVDTTFFSGNRGTGAATWTKANPMFNPQQAGIINSLADLPALEYRDCHFARMATNLRQDLAREL